MAATMALSPPRLANLTLPELIEVEMLVSLSGGGFSRPSQHQLFHRARIQAKVQQAYTTLLVAMGKGVADLLNTVYLRVKDWMMCGVGVCLVGL